MNLTLTKEEQDCFDRIKTGGFLEDCPWNSRSTIDPNITYAQRDKYGKWRDRQAWRQRAGKADSVQQV